MSNQEGLQNNLFLFYLYFVLILNLIFFFFSFSSIPDCGLAVMVGGLGPQKTNAGSSGQES